MEILAFVGPFLLPLVGGALGAALINGWFGIKKQQFERKEEHLRWLRDKKLEVYTGFLDSVRVAQKEAGKARSKEDLAEIEKSVTRLKNSPIQLLAPATVVDECDKTLSLTKEAIALIRQNNAITTMERTTLPDQMREKRQEASDALTRAAQLFRADLDAEKNPKKT